MPFVHNQGLALHYEEAGTGSPPLVFVHGFGCDGSDWQHQVAGLQERHRIVTCDLRGHGRSGGADRSCTIEELAEDVGAVLRELALERVVLVGHSLGCRVVLETWARFGGRVAGLVLVDGSVAGSGDPAAVLERNRRMIEAVGYPEFARATFASMFFDDRHEALRERVLARALRLDAGVGAALRCNNAAWDAARMQAALAEVRVPLLAVQSTDFTEDLQRFRLRHGQRTRWLRLVEALVPAARIEIIPGPGHFVMLEAPQAVNRLLADFVDRVGVRASTPSP